MSKQEQIIRLAGRIDSANAPEAERAAMAALAAAPGSEPVFDAADLQYISSAGLRVLMKVRKTVGHAVEIRDVSPEVFEILEMTGFTDLFRVRKRMREISVEGCEVIGQGFYGTVYRLDPDTIVKVYSSPDSIPQIENERKMARMAFVKGIPTAISYDIVKVGSSYGSVFELLKAQTLNDLLVAQPDRLEELTAQFVEVLKSVHAARMDPGALPSAREIWLGYLDLIRSRGYVTEAQFGRLRQLLLDVPERYSAIHGDFHMKNIMLVDGEPMLIDMDTLAAGDPIFDLQGVYVTYQEFGEDDPDNSLAFLGIDQQMCDVIWRRTLERYFGTEDEAALSGISDRIRLVAAVRFLFLIDADDWKDDPLTQVRIAHTQAHIAELLERVDSLRLPIA